MRSLALAVTLAACASAPRDLPPPSLPERAGVDTLVAARAAGVQFLAQGTSELGWILVEVTIDGVTLTGCGRDV